MTTSHATQRERPTTSTAVRGLMALAAASFAAASVVHLGVAIRLGPVWVYDPFPGAAIPEAVIAIVLAGGLAAATARRWAGSSVPLTTSLFALLLTVYGLTVTLGIRPN